MRDEAMRPILKYGMPFSSYPFIKILHYDYTEYIEYLYSEQSKYHNNLIL